MLENQGYDATFGNPADDPYLASTLPAAGALLTDYYAIGHLSNDNYIALVSGQAPNPLNQADCQSFVDFPPTATVSAAGQISDSGCVFPSSVQTVANQLERAHLTWKGYMEDMGNIPSREPTVCAHPPIGAADHTQKAVAGDGYATRHDPFVYFHSIIDDAASCDVHVVPLGTTTGALPAGTPTGTTALATDLKSVVDHPQLQCHRAQPVQRRPRRPLPQPASQQLIADQHRLLPPAHGFLSSPVRRPSRRTGCSK